MKTIEERADALAYEIAKSFYGFYNGDDCGSRTAILYFENNWRHLPGLHALVGRARSLVSPILTELAADLQAEKEKEVAELKEKLATLAKDYSEVVAGESEMEELTRLRAMLDEVKRVLAMAKNRALDWDMLGRAHGNSAVQMWREDALKLLTRLGSHE